VLHSVAPQAAEAYSRGDSESAAIWRDFWDQLVKDSLPFAVQVTRKNADTCRVAARTGERGHKARADHIVGDRKDGDGLRNPLRGANG
jgi:hypothetical protein